MSHTIIINNVDTKTINGFDNVVCRVHYTLTVSNGLNSVSEEFKLLLIDPDDVENYPDTSSFTEYANLTQEQMIGWVEADVAFNNIVRSLNQQLPQPSTETTNSPTLPWV